MRPPFLDNPRARWVHAPRQYQTAAEYADPFHHEATAKHYPRAWWISLGLLAAAGFSFLLLV